MQCKTVFQFLHSLQTLSIDSANLLFPIDRAMSKYYNAKIPKKFAQI